MTDPQNTNLMRFNNFKIIAWTDLRKHSFKESSRSRKCTVLFSG